MSAERLIPLILEKRFPQPLDARFVVNCASIPCWNPRPPRGRGRSASRSLPLPNPPAEPLTQI